MSDNLIAFLRARYDEEARRAKAACHGGDGIWTQPYPDDSPGMVTDSTGEYVVYDDSLTTGEQAAHIASHHPASALADADAKRRLLALHRFEPYDDEPDIGFCPECQRGGAAGMHPCTTLRLLALPYAAHPGYRPEWDPSRRAGE